MTNVPEITPEELIRTIEAGDEIQVLDVRAPQRLASGHIDLLPEDHFFNMAGSQIRALDDVAEIGMDKSQPVAVVCGHGNSSKTITTFLEERGYNARSIRGGMAAWMNAAFPRDLPTPTGLGALVQFDRVGKGSLAYLVVSDGEALIIDPAREPRPYLARADELGAAVVAVADTHVHADYISGASSLARQLDVPYYLHPLDNRHVYEGTPGKLDITPVEDGSTITLGRASIDVFHTPGHTEGSATYLIGDEAAFTGDFIFVRSIGRPDLGGKIDTWAVQLWHSIERAREKLQGASTIYPAHYASDLERGADRSIGATFDEVRRANEPLQIQTEAEFVEWVRARETSFPDAYRKIKVINVGRLDVSAEEAEELDVGKNECAV